MKICTNCKKSYDSNNFYKQKSLKDGLTTQCKLCFSIRSKEYRNRKPEILQNWRIKNKEKFREYNTFYKLQNKFNLSKEDYHKMLEKQNYVCKICKNIQIKSKAVLCVDHDHKTGKIRGLLCDLCNKGLGFFKDDCNLLKNAVEYIINNQTNGSNNV